MYGADLCGANLCEADLRGANLRGADLRRADLQNTCLDPDNEANGCVDDFEQSARPGYIVGYRTESTPHIGKFIVGRTYGADYFSTSVTECHPGLYLWPSLSRAKSFSGDGSSLVKVLASANHTHKAGSKWRTRWFEVVEKL
ncbi:MAG: pentapeptide repeat-containing protein [Planctomycetota bacterium]